MVLTPKKFLDFKTYDAKKKGQLTKQLKHVQKNNQCLRRAVECLFYLTPDQKEGVCHI